MLSPNCNRYQIVLGQRRCHKELSGNSVDNEEKKLIVNRQLVVYTIVNKMFLVDLF